jgi:hypothetical protein
MNKELVDILFNRENMYKMFTRILKLQLECSDEVNDRYKGYRADFFKEVDWLLDDLCSQLRQIGEGIVNEVYTKDEQDSIVEHYNNEPPEIKQKQDRMDELILERYVPAVKKIVDKALANIDEVAEYK